MLSGPPPAPHERPWLATHPVTGWLLLCCIGSWLVWSPLLLHARGLHVAWLDDPLARHALDALGCWSGPLLAALLSTRAGLRAGCAPRLLGGMRGTPLRWYLLAALVVPLAALALALLGTPAPRWDANPVVSALLLVALLLVALPLETGWRGHAMTRLQERRTPLATALLLGGAWCLWRAPMLLTVRWHSAGAPGFVAGIVVTALAAQLWLCWLANRSGSLAVPVLGHGLGLWALVALPASTGRTGTWPLALAAVALAALALLAGRGRLAGRSRPASGRRGCVPSQTEPSDRARVARKWPA